MDSNARDLVRKNGESSEEGREFWKKQKFSHTISTIRPYPFLLIAHRFDRRSIARVFFAASITSIVLIGTISLLLFAPIPDWAMLPILFVGLPPLIFVLPSYLLRTLPMASEGTRIHLTHDHLRLKIETENSFEISNGHLKCVHEDDEKLIVEASGRAFSIPRWLDTGNFRTAAHFFEIWEVLGAGRLSTLAVRASFRDGELNFRGETVNTGHRHRVAHRR